MGERSGWLVIFDIAPDPVAVSEFLPGAGGGGTSFGGVGAGRSGALTPLLGAGPDEGGGAAMGGGIEGDPAAAP